MLMKTNPIDYSIHYGAGALHLQCLQEQEQGTVCMASGLVPCVQMKQFSSHLKGLAIHIPFIMSVGHDVKKTYLFYNGTEVCS